MEQCGSNARRTWMGVCWIQVERKITGVEFSATIFHHNTSFGLHILHTMNRYILLTGAPGSKWSSVAESIYQSSDVDRSDISTARAYEQGSVKHTGAYFDPGMEYDNALKNWDLPFSGTGKRIIKSHTFAHQLPSLKAQGYPIVMVYRNDVDCYNWWIDAGGFDITYPRYDYFKPLDNMWNHIQQQNKDIMQFVKDNQENITNATNSQELCRSLGLTLPNTVKDYALNDIKVYVY